MWHEARRQEKKIRGLMVDFKKRAERRREFYEKIKADPAQFVRVFGQACKINLDPAIALAAESPQSMMPWQGDASNMIDRFDVRAHLDILPPETSYTVQLSKEEEDEERRGNYERYRIIVENESAGYTEEQALQQIYIDEQFGAINKEGDEEKNKLKDKKAAIGYTYEDSAEKKVDNVTSDSEDDEEPDDIETFDLDVALDLELLTPDQISQLNVCGTQFGMGKHDYIKYLRRDRDEQEALKQAKLIEEEKAQFAGRKSRRERRIYKEKRLAGRKLSPPSYAARESPKYEPFRRSSSRSRSGSPPQHKKKKIYITSFGKNEDSDDDGGGIVQGPVLPPGIKLGLEHSEVDSNQRTADTCDGKAKKESLRQRLGKSLSVDGNLSPRSKDRQYRSHKSRSKSPDRTSVSSRSHNRNSRSRDSSNRDPRSRDSRRYPRSGDRRSRERSRSRMSREQSRSRRSRDRSRSQRSRDRSRSQRSRDRFRDRRSGEWSRDRRSRSRDSKSYILGERRHGYRHQRSMSRSHSQSRRKSSSPQSHKKSLSPVSSSSRSSSKSSKDSKSGSLTNAKPVIKRYRRESLSSESSSESENEAPTKSRSANTNSDSTPLSTKPLVPYGKSSSFTQPKLTPQEKLKRKMQIALNKQYKADKKAEILKLEKMEQEKLDREEELRQRAMEMRRREREKRHRERELYGTDSEDSDASSLVSSPQRPKMDDKPKSPSGKSHKENTEVVPRTKKISSRSSSRSRSRSPHRKKIVDY